MRSTRAESGSFILINPNTGFLDIEASHNLSERARRVKLRPGEGITGWVATTGQPLRTRRRPRGKTLRLDQRAGPLGDGRAGRDARPGHRPAQRRLDRRSTPSARPTRRGSSTWRSEAAQWLELAWEIDQFRLKGRQLTSLVDIAQMIIAETNLDEILKQITVQTLRLMKARICSVFLLNEDATELVLRACEGGSKLYREKPNLSMEDSLLGTVVTRRKPLAVVDVVEEKGYIQTDIARKERARLHARRAADFRGQGAGRARRSTRSSGTVFPTTRSSSSPRWAISPPWRSRRAGCWRASSTWRKNCAPASGSPPSACSRRRSRTKSAIRSPSCRCFSTR